MRTSVLDCEHDRSFTDGTARKSAVESASSVARIIEPPRSKSVGELHRAIMDWALRVAEHAARYNESVQDTVTVPAMKRMMMAELAARRIEGPNTYAELRSCMAACVGENMVQPGHGPLGIGDVDHGDAPLVEVRPRSHEGAPSQRDRAPVTHGGARKHADFLSRRRQRSVNLTAAKNLERLEDK